jgi:ABC-type uncharacterized transport system YnjBCD ATPase subunit
VLVDRSAQVELDGDTHWSHGGHTYLFPVVVGMRHHALYIQGDVWLKEHRQIAIKWHKRTRALLQMNGLLRHSIFGNSSDISQSADVAKTNF